MWWGNFYFSLNFFFLFGANWVPFSSLFSGGSGNFRVVICTSGLGSTRIHLLFFSLFRFGVSLLFE